MRIVRDFRIILSSRMFSEGNSNYKINKISSLLKLKVIMNSMAAFVEPTVLFLTFLDSRLIFLSDKVRN